MTNNRIGFSRVVVFVVLLLVGACAVFADVKLPAVIGDNMVLQQGAKASIWGWAAPNEEVMVSVSWSTMQWGVKPGKDGKWQFEMNAPKPGGPYEMTFRAKNTITVKNILVGEVWVCSGQSNMAMSVRGSNDADQEIAAADFPNIRLFTVQRQVAEEPQSDCTGSWTLCSPETVPNFSAVAYYFGRKLHKDLNVPIGLIHTSWGGTPAEAWTRTEALKADEDFAPIFARHDQAVARYPQAKADYEKKLEQWKKKAEEAKAAGEDAPKKPRGPGAPLNSHTPAALYNAMIAPLIPYRIQGAIWYQGESNAGRAYQYRKLFPNMIKNWRADWGQGSFPFLFVQLANFKAVKEDPAESAWAELREAQSMTLALPNTGMAVIIDIGNANNIHPKNKQDVGKRLAIWSLGTTYGKKIVYSGPLYKSMKAQGGKITLTFDHVGTGLVAKGNDGLKGFAVAGEDKNFVWADAKIEGDTVVVSAATVANPVAVRYAWADNPVCNLYNKEDLPASSFRTDDWPGETVDAK